MIAVRELRVEAGGFVVGPVDLRLDDGEYGVLLGPSGAGKSLVLEAVAGVRRVAAGAVVVGETEVTDLAPERRRVGLVFQDGLLFPHLSVAANIAYGARGRRDGTEVRRLAAEVGASDLLGRRPATLSGGERQRVALARALAARPRALLLDEPLSAVDGEAREELQDVLRRVCRAEGLPVLHVTHDRAEAFALADTCAVMVAGRVCQVGRPLDVLRRPADEAVARFLGARNVLPARRDARDSCVARLGSGMAIRTGGPLPAGDVLIVIRPEDVRLEVVPPGAGAAAHATAEADGLTLDGAMGSVTRLTLQGGHVLVRLDGPVSLEALTPVGALEAAGIGVGSQVSIRVDATAVHVLPQP